MSNGTVGAGAKANGAGSDVNGDGRLDISDVVAIVNEILGQ